MMLTSLNVVSPSTSMNVVRMDTAAMSSGSSARNDANTKSSTRSAPAAPSRVSIRTLASSWSPPAASRAYEVRPLSKPCGCGRLVEGGVELRLDVGPELHRDRSLDQGVRRAAVVGDEARISRAREVHDSQLHVGHRRHGGRDDTARQRPGSPATVSPSGTVTTAT